MQVSQLFFDGKEGNHYSAKVNEKINKHYSWLYAEPNDAAKKLK